MSDIGTLTSGHFEQVCENICVSSLLQSLKYLIDTLEHGCSVQTVVPTAVAEYRCYIIDGQ